MGSMKSILQKKKECWFCKTTENLELHHIYFGTANRQISDKNGFVVYLCHRHHTGSNLSVHLNRKMDMTLKVCCQSKFEEKHTREEFRKIIGKSYL